MPKNLDRDFFVKKDKMSFEKYLKQREFQKTKNGFVITRPSLEKISKILVNFVHLTGLNFRTEWSENKNLYTAEIIINYD